MDKQALENLKEFFGQSLVIIFLKESELPFHVGYIVSVDDQFLYVHDPKCGDMALPLKTIESVKKYNGGRK